MNGEEGEVNWGGGGSEWGGSEWGGGGESEWGSDGSEVGSFVGSFVEERGGWGERGGELF